MFYMPGTKVRFTQRVRPLYMCGQEATVLRTKRSGKVVVMMDTPTGRFTGEVVCSANQIEERTESRMAQQALFAPDPTQSPSRAPQRPHRPSYRPSAPPFRPRPARQKSTYSGPTWYSEDTPKWVRDLVEKVKAEYDVPLRKVICTPYYALPVRARRRMAAYESSGRLHEFSRGTAWITRGQIAIRLGSEKKGQAYVVLHELAHMICDVGDHHGPLFWRTAWKLYKQFAEELNLDIPYVYEHEVSYRKGAAQGFRSVYGRSRP